MAHCIFSTHLPLVRYPVQIIDWLVFPHMFQAVLSYADDMPDSHWTHISN